MGGVVLQGVLDVTPNTLGMTSWTVLFVHLYQTTRCKNEQGTSFCWPLGGFHGVPPKHAVFRW